MGSETTGLIIALLLVTSLLAALGAAASVFGADSRMPPEDDHGPRRGSDWT
jgi:hypothetical protein